MAATASDWVLKDNGYRTFLHDLQTAVRSNDRRAVLHLVSFPVRVNHGGGSRVYRSRSAAENDYNHIFTPNVQRAVLAQKFENLFGRDQGVMIGDGEVWFDHICLDRTCRTKARCGSSRSTDSRGLKAELTRSPLSENLPRAEWENIRGNRQEAVSSLGLSRSACACHTEFGAADEGRAKSKRDGRWAPCERDRSRDAAESAEAARRRSTIRGCRGRQACCSRISRSAKWAVLLLVLLLGLFLFVRACVPRAISDLRLVALREVPASALPAMDNIRKTLIDRGESLWKITLEGDADWVREVRRHELNVYAIVVRCDARDDELFSLGPYVGNARISYRQGAERLGQLSGTLRYDIFVPQTGRYRSRRDFNAPMPGYDLSRERLKLCISIAGGAMTGAYGRSNDVGVLVGPER